MSKSYLLSWMCENYHLSFIIPFRTFTNKFTESSIKETEITFYVNYPMIIGFSLMKFKWIKDKTIVSECCSASVTYVFTQLFDHLKWRNLQKTCFLYFLSWRVVRFVLLDIRGIKKETTGFSETKWCDYTFYINNFINSSQFVTANQSAQDQIIIFKVN